MPHRPWLRRSAPRLVVGALLAAGGLVGPTTMVPAAAASGVAVTAPVPALAEHSRTGYAQTGYAQTGYAQTGYAQTGYAQTGYAQTGYAQGDGLVAHEQLAPLRAQQAWRYATGDGVTVAVLDSGVDAAHPDLAGRVRPGADYVDGSTDGRTDSVGHGTTVASLIAGQGVEAPSVGLAPEAAILPVRVLDDENRYQSAATVAEGVVWAVDQGAQVINLSLGGDRPSGTLGEALAYAMAHDVVVVACTGNVTGDPDAQVWYPAREPGVIGVSGLIWDQNGSPLGWSESLTGPETVLAAPAVVTGAQAGGGHRAVQGTSFSSALVAAAAALIRSHWPELPAADVVNRLVATATDVGEPGRDALFGFGVVDPVAALTGTVPPAPTNPLDTKARHGTAGFGPAPHRPPPVAVVPEPTQPASGFELVPGQPAGVDAEDPAAAAGRTGPPPARLVAAIGVAAAAAGLLALLLLARLAAPARRSRGPGRSERAPDRS